MAEPPTPRDHALARIAAAGIAIPADRVDLIADAAPLVTALTRRVHRRMRYADEPSATIGLSMPPVSGGRS